MPALDVLTAQLQDNAHTYATDLSAVSSWIEELTEKFVVSITDVYIDNAAISLTNAAGYPVGQLVWSSPSETFIFVAAVDEVS